MSKSYTFESAIRWYIAGTERCCTSDETADGYQTVDKSDRHFTTLDLCKSMKVTGRKSLSVGADQPDDLHAVAARISARPRAASRAAARGPTPPSTKRFSPKGENSNSSPRFPIQGSNHSTCLRSTLSPSPADLFWTGAFYPCGSISRSSSGERKTNASAKRNLLR